MNGFSLQCGMLGNAGGPVTQAVTNGPFGSLRNDFDGLLGMRIYFDSAKTITSLSRWKVSGNSGTHTLKLWTDANVELASCVVDLSGGSAGSFVSAAITPVFCAGAAFYRISSTEVNAGDQWYDSAGGYTFASDISTPTSYFGTGSVLDNAVAGDQLYVPVGFLFTE